MVNRSAKKWGSGGRATAGLAVLAASLAILPGQPSATLEILEVVDNRSEYPGQLIPQNEKLEITFHIRNTVAENLQFPYDPEPPPGIRAGIGISVDAEFTPDNWTTVYRQPAFLYQEFRDEIRQGQEWFYPTEEFSWKVRFAPPHPGHWQYRLAAEDAGGASWSPGFSFQVEESSNPGFVRVSPKDSRYFEFEDGTYFPALGYNMNYDRVSWRNPILDNRENFEIMGANGIQLIRIWLSQWAIFGAEWNPWNSQDPAQHGASLPANGITFEAAAPGSDVSMKITAPNRPCMFIGVWKARPALEPQRLYRVRIRYQAKDLGVPVDPSQPAGFVAKTGDWLWSADPSQRCYSSGTGTPVTPYVDRDLSGGEWEVLEGWLESGNRHFLPNFFLVLENLESGSVFVDHVAIEEDLGGGRFGPNIVSKPWMAHHQYFEQRNSYAFDKLLELARQHGVYLRPVIHEKNDRILNRIDWDGRPDPQPNGNNNFFGNWRNPSKVRWLQKAWWRYSQARWGYSTQIHSWELLNEGDPFNGRHFTLADELGKYMHQFANWHLVSTSTWHSFPREAFWNNPAFPDIDFADVHRYITRGRDVSLRVDNQHYPLGSSADYFDTAAATAQLGELIGAASLLGTGKPVIRGETGFVTGSSAPADPELQGDQAGLWLHNFIWGGIHPGGVIESYWYDTAHIYRRNHDGSYQFDHRHHFGAFHRFIRDIPLSNGNYEDARANVSQPQLRVWGQKDTLAGRAHLWIQNTEHDWWKASVSPESVSEVGGVVAVAGFRPNTLYRVEWWDTYQGTPTHRQTTRTDSQGALRLEINHLHSDIAVRIGDYGNASNRPPRNQWRIR